MKRQTPEQLAYANGFRRALMLMLGMNGIMWTRADKTHRNHVARQFFGKKRTRRCRCTTA
jgi:hypothetical protein